VINASRRGERYAHVRIGGRSTPQAQTAAAATAAAATATTGAMIYSGTCALGCGSLPVFPGPFPQGQFDALQNDVMDFAALLESGLP
jgi:hypothetical protein